MPGSLAPYNSYEIEVEAVLNGGGGGKRKTITHIINMIEIEVPPLNVHIDDNLIVNPINPNSEFKLNIDYDKEIDLAYFNVILLYNNN